MTPDARQTNLIIAGSSRCGTTSLFLYLRDHPAVCGASVKETGYFLDDSFPRQGKYRYTDAAASYHEYFKACDDRPVFLEATPDYLYAPGAAERIRIALPNPRLIFILRDPVQRLVSWYRFARQLGRLPDDVTFDEYVKSQWHSPDEGDPVERQHRMAMVHGQYSNYLRDYVTRFTADQILILTFEALRRNPHAVARRVCRFVGIDPGFFDNYTFQPFNQSQTMRNPGLNRRYIIARNWLRREVSDRPLIRTALQPVRRVLEPVLFRINRGDDAPVEISAITQHQLANFYSGEAAKLAVLLGRPTFDWSDPSI